MIDYMIEAMSNYESLTDFLSKSATDPCQQYSITIHTPLGAIQQPKHLITCSLLQSIIICSSLATFSLDYSEQASTLIATGVPDWRWMALQTLPQEPWPMTQRMLYQLSCIQNLNLIMNKKGCLPCHHVQALRKITNQYQLLNAKHLHLLQATLAKKGKSGAQQKLLMDQIGSQRQLRSVLQGQLKLLETKLSRQQEQKQLLRVRVGQLQTCLQQNQKELNFLIGKHRELMGIVVKPDKNYDSPQEKQDLIEQFIKVLNSFAQKHRHYRPPKLALARIEELQQSVTLLTFQRTKLQLQISKLVEQTEKQGERLSMYQQKISQQDQMSSVWQSKHNQLQEQFRRFIDDLTVVQKIKK